MIESENLKILLVDDDPLVLRIVTRQLQRKSFVVDTAGSAEKALELLTKSNYRAVVTDYEMSGKTGIWLLEKLAETAPDTCRILHSGSDLTNVETHIKSGVVQCFLSKPAPQIGSFLSALFSPTLKPAPRKETYSKAYHRWIQA